MSCCCYIRWYLPQHSSASHPSPKELLLSWEETGRGWQSKWELIGQPSSCEFFWFRKNECLNNSILLKAQLFRIWEECLDDCITLTTTLVIFWFVLQIWRKSQKFGAQHVPFTSRAFMENNTCNAKLAYPRWYYLALSVVV